jgi:hypothetical protein
VDFQNFFQSFDKTYMSKRMDSKLDAQHHLVPNASLKKLMMNAPSMTAIVIHLMGVLGSASAIGTSKKKAKPSLMRGCMLKSHHFK